MSAWESGTQGDAIEPRGNSLLAREAAGADEAGARVAASVGANGMNAVVPLPSMKGRDTRRTPRAARASGTRARQASARLGAAGQRELSHAPSVHHRSIERARRFQRNGFKGSGGPGDRGRVVGGEDIEGHVG